MKIIVVMLFGEWLWFLLLFYLQGQVTSYNRIQLILIGGWIIWQDVGHQELGLIKYLLS